MSYCAVTHTMRHLYKHPIMIDTTRNDDMSVIIYMIRKSRHSFFLFFSFCCFSLLILEISLCIRVYLLIQFSIFSSLFPIPSMYKIFFFGWISRLTHMLHRWIDKWEIISGFFFLLEDFNLLLLITEIMFCMTRLTKNSLYDKNYSFWHWFNMKDRYIKLTHQWFVLII